MTATLSMIGLLWDEYSASTQWAMALIPDVYVRCRGRVNVRSTSYTIVVGRILGSDRVVLRLLTVSPRIGVASLPA
jgi:hypothetical protein